MWVSARIGDTDIAGIAMKTEVALTVIIWIFIGTGTHRSHTMQNWCSSSVIMKAWAALALIVDIFVRTGTYIDDTGVSCGIF